MKGDRKTNRSEFFQLNNVYNTIRRRFSYHLDATQSICRDVSDHYRSIVTARVIFRALFHHGIVQHITPISPVRHALIARYRSQGLKKIKSKLKLILP